MVQLHRSSLLSPIARPVTGTDSGAGLTHIEVEELFGLYTYHLKASTIQEVSPRLLILYGDNGSGKTTLLQLVYHLLSKEDDRGHRTFLAGVPFRRLSVTLSNGATVSASRVSDRLTGSYLLSVQLSDGLEVRALATADEKNIIAKAERQSDADRQAWASVIRALATLHLNLYYLPDDRRLESPFSSPADDQHVRVLVDDEHIVRRHVILQNEFQIAQSSPLEAALRRTTDWVRSEALRASNIGQANANTIYATIMQQILRTRGSRSKNRRLDLAGELRELEDRSRLFSSYGLTSELDISELSAALRSAASDKREVMEDVLHPYVDGLKARLDAMQRLQTLLAAFLNSLNGFFTNKTVRFTIDEGLQIVSRNGEMLAPSALSSGEKQLLLLFCNVIAAKDQAAVFLLDEPELSLNIKWQRKLLATLLELIGDSPVQLLVATHSLELLSGFRSNVLRLTDAPG